MSRPCPSCRTSGADYDDPQGLCGECAASLDNCLDCTERDQCAACADDFNFSQSKDER